MKNYIFIIVLCILTTFSCTTDSVEIFEEELVTVNSDEIFEEKSSETNSQQQGRCVLCEIDTPEVCSSFQCGLADGVRDGSRDRAAFAQVNAAAFEIETIIKAFDLRTGKSRTINRFSERRENEIAFHVSSFRQTGGELSIAFFNSSDTQFRLNFLNSQQSSNASPGSEYWRGVYSGYLAGTFFGSGAGTGL